MNLQPSEKQTRRREEKRARERDRENRKIIFSCTDRVLVCTLARSLLMLTEHANHTNSGTRSRLERIFTYVLGFRPHKVFTEAEGKLIADSWWCVTVASSHSPSLDTVTWVRATSGPRAAMTQQLAVFVVSWGKEAVCV